MDLMSSPFQLCCNSNVLSDMTPKAVRQEKDACCAAVFQTNYEKKNGERGRCSCSPHCSEEGLAVGLTGSTIGSLLMVQKRLAKSTYHSSLSEYCSI